jgi:hypothetical protein
MSLYAGDMSSRIMGGEKLEDVLKNPDAPKTDWTKLEGWTGGINPNGMYNVTSTPVLCKDGTTKNQLSSPMGKYADACVNNGGRAVNQPVVVNTEVYAKPNLSSEEKFYESLGIKSRGGWSPTVKAKGRFYLAVVLVAGYFAYKKFKK